MLLYLLIYVDDILIMGNSSYDISRMIAHLSQLFSMKDLGLLHYFIGIDATRTTMGLHLCQSKYILDLLHHTEFLIQSLGQNLQWVVAVLVRLMVICFQIPPNIVVFSALWSILQLLIWIFHLLSWLTIHASPTKTHWCAAKHILRYLKSIITHGLLLWYYKLILMQTTLAILMITDLLGVLIHLLVLLFHGVLRSKKAFLIRSLFKDLHIPLDFSSIWCDNIGPFPWPPILCFRQWTVMWELTTIMSEKSLFVESLMFVISLL